MNSGWADGVDCCSRRKSRGSRVGPDETEFSSRAEFARFGAAAGQWDYWVVDFSYRKRYCHTVAAAHALFAGVGDWRGDFAVRVRGFRRTGIDVSRVRWTVRLSARGLRGPGGVSLWVDVVLRGEWRDDRSAVGGCRRLCGSGLPCG